jgi:5-methylcytosine-specific restriction endonuclease McrA
MLRLCTGVFPAFVMRKTRSVVRAAPRVVNNLATPCSMDNRTYVRYNCYMGKRVYDWKAIQQYHDAGHGFVECQKRFGFSHTAWVKAIKRRELVARFRKRGGSAIDPNDRRRIYDWSVIQAYYDAGHSLRECQRRFGFCAASWDKARKRGELKTRRFGMPIERLLSGPRNRHHVKLRLLRAGLLKNQCTDCGLTEWQGKPLSMHIDHINGVKDDHRLQNLRMLCPNCHSQTDTYGGRNARRRKRLQDGGGTM